MSNKLKYLAFFVLGALLQTECWRLVRWIDYDFSIKTIQPFLLNDIPISVHWYTKMQNESLLVMMLLFVIAKLGQMLSNRFYLVGMVALVYKFIDTVLFYLNFSLWENFYLVLLGLVFISSALILYPTKENVTPVKSLK